MGDALSTMLTACSPFVWSRAASMALTLTPFCTSSVQFHWRLLVAPQPWELPLSPTISRHQNNSSDPFALSMPQSLGLPHRYYIFQSTNIATIENPNRFAPSREGRAIQKVLPLGRNMAWVTCYTFLSRCVRCHILWLYFLKWSWQIGCKRNMYIGDYHSSPFFAPFVRRGALRRGDSKQSYNNSSRGLRTNTFGLKLMTCSISYDWTCPLNIIFTSL